MSNCIEAVRERDFCLLHETQGGKATTHCNAYECLEKRYFHTKQMWLVFETFQVESEVVMSQIQTL